MAQPDRTKQTMLRAFPRWGFAMLAAGGFWTSGLYAGIARAGDVSTGVLAGAIGFGLMGLAMLWGAVGRRR